MRSGMDVDLVEQAGVRMRADAERIRTLMSATERTVTSLARVWEGPSARRFVSERWPVERKALLASADRVDQMGRALLAHAADQRQASATDGAGAAASPPTPSTRSLVQEFTTMGNTSGNGDLYRIRTVVGEDGVTRHIVYIDGTKGALSDLGSYGQTHGWLANLGSSFGISNEARRQIEAAIAARVGDSGDPVMIVGYSQGGMLAQSIADSGRFNVDEVVTVGSPPVPALHGYGGANVTRLVHNSDVVVAATAAARTHVAVTAVSATGLVGMAGLVLAALSVQDTPFNGEITTFRAGTPTEGPSAHDVTNEGDYGWLADRYDESNDPGVAAARARQRLFTAGVVVGETSHARAH